jgi:hypothetical protein
MLMIYQYLLVTTRVYKMLREKDPSQVTGYLTKSSERKWKCLQVLLGLLIVGLEFASSWCFHNLSIKLYNL